MSSSVNRKSFKCQEGQLCHQTTVWFFCWERVLGMVSPGKSLASVCGDTKLSLHPNGVFFYRISTVKSWYSSKKKQQETKKIRAPCVGILQSELSAKIFVCAFPTYFRVILLPPTSKNWWRHVTSSLMTSLWDEWDSNFSPTTKWNMEP